MTKPLRIRIGPMERATGMFCVALVAGAVGASAAHAAFPGVNGRIAFQRIEIAHFGPISGPRSFDVYSMTADGGGVVSLTSSIGDVLRPAWSPDGDRLAFDSEGQGISIMRPDGTGVTHVPNTGPGDYGAAWAPDGQKLAFTRSRFDEADIYTINVDGSGARRLTADPAEDSDPAWSPDGGRIAFQSDRAGTPRLYVMKVNGSAVKRLTNTDLGECCAAWSPDGTRIAFAASPAEIYVANADGSNPVALTDHPRADVDPAWSPDGTRIAFASYRDGPPVIYTMNPDGTGLSKLTGTTDRWDTEPDWQPIPVLRRSDYKNAAHFCSAERELLGGTAFHQRYGGGANAHGRCVSGSSSRSTAPRPR